MKCDMADSQAPCAGPLYRRKMQNFYRCRRHIVAQRVWQHSGAAWRLDLYDWLAQLEPAQLQALDDRLGYVSHFQWQEIAED